MNNSNIINIINNEIQKLNENNETYSSFKNKYQQRKNDFINSIKSFNDIDDNKITEILDYFGYEGFNSEEDAFEDLKEKIDFYKTLSNPAKLYRVVGVKNEKMIRTNDLGEHWTPYDWNLDGDMLMSIGYENWDDETKPYVIEALIPHSEIDIVQTIIQNLSFPNEHEINLKNNGKGAKFIKSYGLKGFMNETKNIANIITLYRGIGYNTGNNYYSPSKEFAREFTRSGRDSEIKTIIVSQDRIYEHNPLPRGYGNEDPNFDIAINEAQKQGLNAMWVDEGQGQPESVFVINPKISI